MHDFRVYFGTILVVFFDVSPVVCTILRCILERFRYCFLTFHQCYGRFSGVLWRFTSAMHDCTVYFGTSLELFFDVSPVLCTTSRCILERFWYCFLTFHQCYARFQDVCWNDFGSVFSRFTRAMHDCRAYFGTLSVVFCDVSPVICTIFGCTLERLRDFFLTFHQCYARI